MKSADRLYRASFLKQFLEKFPLYPHRMRNTLHSYSDEDTCPFHLEDDCWAHTMMVFMGMNVEDMKTSTLPENELIACLISALTHDAGKPLSRKSHKPGRVNFWGHAEAGTQTAAEVCYKLVKDHDCFDQILHYVTHSVSRHIDAYEIEDENMLSFFNSDYGLYNVMSRLLVADYMGQISTKGEHDKKDNDLFNRMASIMSGTPRRDAFDTSAPDIMVHCGIPGTGKDHFASEEDREVISLDQIRVELYTKRSPKAADVLPPKELYQEAFRYCRRKKLGPYMIEKLQAAKENGSRIAICNVHSTKKARKQTLEAIRKVYGDEVDVGCHYFLTTLDAAIRTDLTRSDHSVGRDVIMGFGFNQSIPSTSEGFSGVRVTFNTFNVE